MVQPLDQGIIASFKVQLKKKLFKWVLSQFDFGFKFEWRANGGEWCSWPTNTNSWASSSPRVCPITIKSKHPSEFSLVDVMNMQSFMDKLNKIPNANNNKHLQEIINSYFHSVWYGEDIILDYICNSILCDVVSINISLI